MTTSSYHGVPPAAVHSAAARLARDAAAAAELRGWQTHPDVVALRVEQIRTQVDHLIWAGIVLGLCFTMTNVQQFAAAGARVGSLAWCSAWLMDPMVSLVLLAVLRAEQITTRYQVPTGIWPRIAKWALLLATYLMNTWTSWATGSAPGVVLHSVPPLVVVIAAEAITDVQHALTECVQRAHTTALQRAERTTRTDHHLLPHLATGAVNTPPAPPHTLPAEHPVGGPGGHPVNGTGERVMGAAGERGQPHSVTPQRGIPGGLSDRPVNTAAHDARRARVPGKDARCWPTTWRRPARRGPPGW
jgi:hypothetical protein